MKICSKCKQEKDEIEFSVDNNSPDGLCYHCKECKRKYDRTNWRENSLQHKYGIGEAQVELILKSQNGVCAICGQPETTKKYDKIQQLSVDHCHKTGKIRGLLCDVCNKGLGNFKDDPELLRKAAGYLEDNND